MFDAFCKRMSAHELKHRFDGDESRRGSTHHVHVRILVFWNKKKQNKKNKKKRESAFRTLNMPQVHSSAEQNSSHNCETLHHARAVKSSTVVIFEDTKHRVVGLLTVSRR